MVAKISVSGSLAGAINYNMNKLKADSAHIILTNRMLCPQQGEVFKASDIINDFELFMPQRYRTENPVFHVSLNPHPNDKLTEDQLSSIAKEYMDKLGYGNTQVLIVHHTDRDYPHIHLIVNRIDFDGKRISDQNERIRNMKICKELTAKYELYFSSGKENVKRERLREPDATKYRIYDALVKHVPQSKSWEELRSRLRAEGIAVGFKTKGSTSQLEGVRFTMNNLSFNGSKVDRLFSYSKIDFSLRQNARLAETPAPAVDSGLDLGLFEQHGQDYDEEEFRRRMQKKKKRGRRM